MPLTPKKQKAVSAKIRKLKAEGKSQRQSVAQALNTVAPKKTRKRKKK